MITGSATRRDAPRPLDLSRWTSSDIYADCNAMLAMCGNAHCRTPRKLTSEKTRTNRRHVLIPVLRHLRTTVRGFTTLSQFRPRYIKNIIAWWCQRRPDGSPRLAYETQVVHFSTLRWFFRVHGIHVDPIRSYIDDPELRARYKRSTVNTQVKAWSSLGVDAETVLATLAIQSPETEALLRATAVAGLRPKEAARLRAGSDVNHEERALEIRRGSKGGRPRDIKFPGLEWEDVKAILASLAARSGPDGTLGWPGLRLDQVLNRYYAELRKVGICKSGLGVVAYGLRHDFAIRRFEDDTGELAPINGGTTTDLRKLDDARRRLVEALGHSRPSVTGHYLGSFARMVTSEHARYAASAALLEPLLPALHGIASEQGIEQIFWIGRRAAGLNSRPDEPYEFLLDLHARGSAAMELAEAITQLAGVAGLTAVVHLACLATQDIRDSWANAAIPLCGLTAPALTIGGELGHSAGGSAPDHTSTTKTKPE